jgi:lipoate-protein ligase A
MEYLFLDSGTNTAAWNMACDEFLANRAQAEPGVFRLRFYQWSPEAMSIGHSQKCAVEADRERLHRDGLDFVRRPTGGRSVLHHRELTYSVILNTGEILAGGDRKQHYADIHRAFRTGLQRQFPDVLGADAGYRGDARQGRALPCFATSIHTEIVRQGKKIMGSAQRAWGKVLLQHGSLKLGEPELNLVDYMPGSLVRKKELCEILAQHQGYLPWAGTGENLSRLKEDILAGFEVEYKSKFISHRLLETEQEQISGQAAEKYQTAGWNMKY